MNSSVSNILIDQKIMQQKNQTRSTFQRALSEGKLKDRGLVLMDDGGSKMDTPEGIQHRQTWVAVLVPPTDSIEAIEQMDGLLEGVEELFGADELHAHEVFQRKGHWANASINELKAVVAAVSAILRQTDFPIIVQTFWKGNESHGKLIAGYGDQEIRDLKRRFCVDLRKPKDAAFLFCIHRCKNYIKGTYPGSDWSVYADEGMMKPGGSKILPTPWVDGKSVRVGFEDSRVCKLIQLADFAAFFLNRSQQIHFSKKRSKHDEELLDILGSSMNFVNIPYQTMPRIHPVD